MSTPSSTDFQLLASLRKQLSLGCLVIGCDNSASLHGTDRQGGTGFLGLEQLLSERPATTAGRGSRVSPGRGEW